MNLPEDSMNQFMENMMDCYIDHLNITSFGGKYWILHLALMQRF